MPQILDLENPATGILVMDSVLSLGSDFGCMIVIINGKSRLLAHSHSPFY